MASERFVRFTFSGSPFEARDRFFPETSSAPAPVKSGASAGPAQCARPKAAKREAVERVHVDKLTPARFQERYVSKGVPEIIEGLFEEDVSQWELGNFWPLLDEDAPIQCRIHGADRHAVTPSRWTGRSHARHVVTTTGRKYAETIASGVAQREDCYVQSDISTTQAGVCLQ